MAWQMRQFSGWLWRSCVSAAGIPDRYSGPGVRDAAAWEIAAAITPNTAGIYYLAMTTAFMGLQILIETALDPKKRQRMRRVSLAERLLGTTKSLAVR